LIFAPLAFGSVHVWAYAVIEISVFLLLAFLAAGRILTQPRFEWVKTPANGFLIFFLILIGIQFIPLPMSWIAAASPKTADLKIRAAKIIMEAETAGMTKSPETYPALDFPRISRFSRFIHTPHSAQREFLKLAAYLGMFFLVINTVDSINRMNILVLAIVFLGLFEALYAIIEVFSANPMVWWWKSRAGAGRYATGTFIGSNHFAGYMEMAFCMTWGYALTLKKKTPRMVSGLGGSRAAFQRILGWFSPESLKPRKIFYLFAAAVMGISLLLSASRGGILSVGLGIAVTAVVFFLRTRKMTFVLAALALGFFTLGYGLSIGMDPTLEKFEKTQGFFQRMDVSKTLVPMIADYPVMGVGWGNFPDLYPRYAAIDRGRIRYYNGYAHNDWLEAGAEMGIAGLLIMVAAYGAYMVRLIRIWRKRNNAFAVGVGAGVTAAVAALGCHSLFDFNMHIPANPLTLAAIMGLGVVAVHHRGNAYNLSFFFRKGRIKATPIKRFLLIPIILALAACLIRPAAAHFLAEVYCPTEHNSTVNLNTAPDIAAISRAILFRPENEAYYRKQAHCWLEAEQPNETTDEKASRYDRAAAALEIAVRLNPADASGWRDLGDLCRQRTLDGYAYLIKWIPLADQCYDMAAQCAPYSDDILFNAAWYWVWRAGLLPEERPEEKSKNITGPGALTQADGIRKFQSLFSRYLVQNPSKWNPCVDRVKTYFSQDAVVLGIVPEANEEMKKQVLQYLVGKEP
jgi:O-antigen ligase